MNKNLTLGILGGMGTYATIHIFEQYAEVFPAEKEWERPRLIIDNRCTMPSRVRAYLYGENEAKLISEMTESLRGLAALGCTRIILACNTSHLFLPKIYSHEPTLKNYVVDIIDNCVDQVCNDGIKSVYLLASEGTIESGLYQEKLGLKGIECTAPTKTEYAVLRECIEAVKQKKYTEDIKAKFSALINNGKACILGCTEMPILYKMYGGSIAAGRVYDPVLSVLKKLKEEYGYE